MADKFSSKSVPGNFPLFEDLLSRLKKQFDEEGNPIQLLNQLQKVCKILHQVLRY